MLLEELHSLAVVAEAAAQVAATHFVEAQISPRVDQVGPLAKRRAIILLVGVLAVDKQVNKKMHPQAVPHLRLDLLASLPQANLRNQQQPDQVKHLVFSAA